MESTEESKALSAKKNIRQMIKKKRRRWYLRVFLISALLFVFAQILFLYFATPILRSTIQSYVYEESNGLYSLHFDRISINISTRSFVLDGFELNADTALYYQKKRRGEVQHALYEISLPAFEIKGVDGIRFLRTGKLEINSIILDQPFLRLIGLPKEEQNNAKYDIIHQDLYPLMNQHIKALKIDSIIIKEGNFNLFLDQNNRQTAVEDFSVKLSNFYLDSAVYKQNTKLYYAEDISLDIKRYQLQLADGLHLLTARNVHISKSAQEITIDSINMGVSDSSKIEYAHQNLYNLNIPAVKIRGLNIDTAYFNHKVRLQHVSFKAPDFFIHSPPRQHTFKSQISQLESFDLYQLIKVKLQTLSIDTFIIDKAALHFYHHKEPDRPVYDIKHLNVVMNNFFVDSMAHRNRQKIFYADDIALNIYGYRMRLADQMHELHADTLMLNTRQSQLSAFNVKLQAINNADKQTSTRNYQITLPAFLIEGVDIHKFYNYRQLHINNFNIKSPTVNINSYDQNTNRQQQKDVDKLLAYYIEQIFVKRIQINNVAFNINYFVGGLKAGYTSGKISAQLEGFRFPTPSILSDNLRTFYADGLDFNLTDYTVKTPDNLHILKIDKAELSSDKSQINLRGIHLRADTNEQAISLLKKYGDNSLLELDIDQLNMNDADVHRAYFHQELTIDSINIHNPTIKYINYLNLQSNNNLKNSKLKSLIDSLDTRDESNEVKLSHNITETIVGKDSLLLFLNDSLISQTTDSLHLTYHDSMLIYNGDSLKISTHDSLWISSKDSLKVYQKDSLVAVHTDSIFIKPPQADIPLRGIYALLTSYLKSIKVKQLNLLNGHLNVVLNDSIGREQWAFNNKVSLGLRNFHIQRDSLYRDKRILFSEGISLKLDDYLFRLPDQVHLIQIKRISLSTDQENLLLSDVEIVPQLSMADSLNSRQVFYMQIPSLSLNGINMSKAYYDRQIKLNNLRFFEPEIKLIRRIDSIKQQMVDSSKTIVKIPKQIETIDIDEIELIDALFSLADQKDTMQKVVLKTTISANIQGFHLDSSLLTQDKDLFDVKDISINLSEFEYQLPDSIHYIKAKQIDMSTSNNNLLIKGFHFTYDSTRNHEPRLRRQNKAVLTNLYIPELHCQGLNCNKLYRQHRLTIRSLTAEQPLLQSLSYQHLNPQTITKPQQLQLYQRIKNQLKSLEINELKFNDLAIHQKKQWLDSSSTNRLSHISGYFQGIAIDSASYRRNASHFYADNMFLQLKHYNTLTPDSLYKISIGEIGLSSARSQVYLDSIALSPQISKQAFMRHHKGFQHAIFDLYGKRVTIDGFQLNPFLENREITARKLSLYEFDCHAYKNITLPHDSSRQVALPQTMLFRSPYNIQIDSLEINKSFFVYEQKSKPEGNNALFTVEDIEGQVVNINNKENDKNKETLTADLYGKLMGEGFFEFHLLMPLGSNHKHFSYHGEVGKMKLSSLNPFSVSAMDASFDGGRVDHLNFSVNANDSLAKGEMIFRYSDMSLTMLAEEEQINNKRQKRGFSSFFLNRITRNDNPKKGRIRARIGNIYFIRDDSRFVTHYIIQSLVSGITSTVLFDNKHQRQQKKEKNQKQLMKKRRKAEKAERRWMERRKRRNERLRQKQQRQDKRQDRRDNRKNKENKPHRQTHVE